MNHRVKLLTMGAISGFVAPALAFGCVLLAIYSYPLFSWTDNALSDLGILPGLTGITFNFGLCAGGFFVFNFAVLGLRSLFGRLWIGKIGAGVFAAVGLSLMGIGFFPENVVPVHYLFSVAFFVLMPISLVILAIAFVVVRQAKLAGFSLLIGVAAALPWVLHFTIHCTSGVAIPEFLSALAGSMWVFLLSYKMFKVASQSNI